MLEVHNFTQDDLLSDDVMILDFHNVIYVWVGQHTSPDNKGHTLDIAKVLLIPWTQVVVCNFLYGMDGL